MRYGNLLCFILLTGSSAYSIADANLEGAIERGRAVFNDRDRGHCLLCHNLSSNRESFQGNLAPSLDGVASRMSKADLRARIEDSRQFNPTTVMPPYFSAEGTNQVAPQFKGKTVLTKQEIDDLVLYLIKETDA